MSVVDLVSRRPFCGPQPDYRALYLRAQGHLERERAARRDAEAAAERGRRALREGDLLGSVARFANGTSCEDDALRFALAEVCARAGWDLGCAYRPAERGPPRLIPTPVCHLADGSLGVFRVADGGAEFPFGVGLPGRVWAARRPLWAADGAAEGDPGRRAAASICGLRAGMAVPVLVADEVVTVAAFFARAAAAPDPTFLGVLAEIGREIGRVAARGRAVRRLTHDATHDALTGLPNRSLFLDRLDEAAARGRPGAVLFVDLDGFKRVNDSLGHAAGDRLLAAIGSRLAAAARAAGPGHLAARLGGDEFAMLLDGAAEARGAEAVAAGLLRSLAEPFDIEGTAVRATASIGIAASGPGDAVGRTTMGDADAALYRAKSAGRARAATLGGPTAGLSAPRRGAARGR